MSGNDSIMANAIRGALVAKWPALTTYPADVFVGVIQSAIARAAFKGTSMAIDSTEEDQVPPCIEHVTAYFKQLGSKTDPEDFYLFYNQKNWMISGRQKMKNWRSAAKRWHRNKWGIPPADGGKKALFA